METWKFYLLLTLLFIATQAVFAMLEMATICFNKVRLQYWVSQGKRRAKWLSHLLSRPGLLFGTVLIGINASLLIGSECSRRLYEAMGYSPDWAPLSQIFIVILFAELIPMFAGMRYAEHAAMLGVPLLYVSSIILRPLIWVIDLICNLVNRLLGSPRKEGLFLSREELQYLFEKGEEVNVIVAGIFALKTKTAKHVRVC